MKKFPLIPVLLGVGALGTLYLISRPTTVQPLPGPQPSPQPLPGPQPRQDLLNQMMALILKAKQDPQSVTPEQFDGLANQLEAAGYTNEAATLRQFAMDLRLGQQKPPILAPAPNGLLQKYQDLLTQVRNPQSTIVISDLENLANDLRQKGFSNEAQVLQLQADKAKLERDPLPCLVPPCPYGPVKLNRPILGMDTWISAQNTGFIIPNVPPGEWGHVKVRPTKINTNSVDVIIVAYKPTIQSPELTPTAKAPILLTIPLINWIPTLR